MHETSDFYDLPGFKAGKSSLRPIERSELTDVAGRSLLHLQCHFGLDTLSWARLGALVTGVDFSEPSIALAHAQTPLRTWYIWNHSLGEILGVLLDAGLRIEFLHEFPFAMRAKFPGMQRSDDGTWRFSKPPAFPLLLSLQARKPEEAHG